MPRDRRPPTEKPSRDVFRLGYIPGATPGKWAHRWHEQRPQQRLELVALDGAAQLAAIRSGEVDAAIVRHPVEGDDLHLVTLYDETPVVVMSADSDLTVADELTPADLEGTVVITPRDDVLGPFDLPGTSPARFDPPETTEDAIAVAATGIGVVIVPLSLARLRHRRDVTHRPLQDGPTSSVALAWLRERDDDDVQALVGITRGRTSRSSR
ncbi:MAG: LysR family substrate-binding domain-containing protein [Microbacterium sp.]